MSRESVEEKVVSILSNKDRTVPRVWTLNVMQGTFRNTGNFDASEYGQKLLINYVPLEHLGEAAGLFVALVRTDDPNTVSSVNVIVGPNGAHCAEEVATLPFTNEGLAIARSIGSVVLQALALSNQWRAGSSWQQEMA